MVDYIEQLKQEAAGLRIIRACHTCRNYRLEVEDDGDELRWCNATGKYWLESQAENLCGRQLRWWEPAPAPEPDAAPAPPVPILVRFKRWLVG